MNIMKIENKWYHLGDKSWVMFSYVHIMNWLYSKSKLIRAVKQSTYLINYVNEINSDLYSVIYVLYTLHILRLIKYLKT